MIVYVNRQHVAGPWGGGNRTIKALHDVLILNDHTPVYDIREKFDVIYCHDPRPNDEGIRYEHLLWLKDNKGIPIFQRVGDVFFHRGQEYTDYLKETLKYSDKVSYITPWAAKFLEQEIDENKHVVHMLRPPKSFYVDRKKRDDKKIRMLTHHWSTNPLKGFDFYLEIDKVLERYSNLEFFYLGRKPDDFKPKNIKVIEVKDEKGVIEELRSADLYVTASKFETGGNHIVEAMANSLPVLYHKDGGGICDLSLDNGYSYSNIEDFQVELSKMIKNIETKENTFDKFEGTLEDVCLEYVKCMEDLVRN